MTTSECEYAEHPKRPCGSCRYCETVDRLTAENKALRDNLPAFILAYITALEGVVSVESLEKARAIVHKSPFSIKESK